MYCPSCGKSIADGSAYCLHCGKTITPPGGAEQRAVCPPGAPLCPKCGQVDVAQKASAIVSAGTATGTAPTTHVGQLGGHVISGTVYKETTSATVLAQRLAPLSDEVVYQRAAFYLSRPTPKGFPTTLKGDIRQFGVPGLELKAEQTIRTYIYWIERQKLHYCARCDVVFLPDERRYAPISNLDSLLFELPEQMRENEICTIIMANVGDFWGSDIKLIAGALGASGYHTVRTSQIRAGVFPNLKRIKGAQEELAKMLEADGWVRSHEVGPEWHELIFRRKSATYVDPEVQHIILDVVANMAMLDEAKKVLTDMQATEARMQSLASVEGDQDMAHETPKQEAFRQFIEVELLRAFKELAESGKTTGAKIAEIAQDCLELVEVGQPISVTYKRAVELCTIHPELYSLFQKIVAEYRNNYISPDQDSIHDL